MTKKVYSTYTYLYKNMYKNEINNCQLIYLAYSSEIKLLKWCMCVLILEVTFAHNTEFLSLGVTKEA